MKKSQLNEIRQDLFVAVEKGEMQNFEYLLDLYKKEMRTKFTINIVNKDGNSLLYLAAKSGNSDMIELISSLKANLNFKNENKMTALQAIVINNNYKAFSSLLAKGASLDVKDGNGNNILHLAALNDNEEVVRFLIKKKFSLKDKNDDNKLAVDLATSAKIKTLLKDDTKSVKTVKRTQTKDFVNNLPRTQNFLNAKGKENLKNEKTKSIKSKVSISTAEKDSSFASKPNKEKKNKDQNSDSEESDVPEDLLNPTKEKIGPSSFNVLTMIGKGSFGEVFLVEKIDTKLLYAMKVLNKSKIKANNLIRYASTERNVLSVSDHPFIVGLKFAFQTHEYLFMILDFAPGGDLSEHIAREGRLSEPLAKVYMCEIILALEDLHNRDIIFRDLKPDNVVLDKDGHALLTDFGLSKEGVETGENTGSFCGLFVNQVDSLFGARDVKQGGTW